MKVNERVVASQVQAKQNYFQCNNMNTNIKIKTFHHGPINEFNRNNDT